MWSFLDSLYSVTVGVDGADVIIRMGAGLLVELGELDVVQYTSLPAVQ